MNISQKGISYTSYACAATLPSVLGNLTKRRVHLRVLYHVVDVTRPFTDPITSCGR